MENAHTAGAEKDDSWARIEDRIRRTIEKNKQDVGFLSGVTHIFWWNDSFHDSFHYEELFVNYVLPRT